VGEEKKGFLWKKREALPLCLAVHFSAEGRLEGVCVCGRGKRADAGAALWLAQKREKIVNLKNQTAQPNEELNCRENGREIKLNWKSAAGEKMNTLWKKGSVFFWATIAASWIQAMFSQICWINNFMTSITLHLLGVYLSPPLHYTVS